MQLFERWRKNMPAKPPRLSILPEGNDVPYLYYVISEFSGEIAELRTKCELAEEQLKEIKAGLFKLIDEKVEGLRNKAILKDQIEDLFNLGKKPTDQAAIPNVNDIDWDKLRSLLSQKPKQ